MARSFPARNRATLSRERPLHEGPLVGVLAVEVHGGGRVECCPIKALIQPREPALHKVRGRDGAVPHDPEAFYAAPLHGFGRGGDGGHDRA
ncbi:hypothetical protein D3C73_1548570 [compost metagenome]